MGVLKDKAIAEFIEVILDNKLDFHEATVLFREARKEVFDATEEASVPTRLGPSGR